MAGSAAALIAAGTAHAAARSADAAAAADVKIADDATRGAGLFTGIDYAKSDRFGRAWLVLHYTTRGPCPAADGECELDAPVNVSVPGLAYDPASRQVVYEKPGDDPVVCATTRRGSLAPTGACTTRLVKVDRVVDDGFAGRKDRREEVHLDVRGR